MTARRRVVGHRKMSNAEFRMTNELSIPSSDFSLRISHFGRAAVGFDEFLRLHEHAARAAAGIVDAAFVGSEHLDKEADDALRGVELAAFFLRRWRIGPRKYS